MEFRFLTDEFFNDYAHCAEMEKKKYRPYAHLCMVEVDGLYFAIPIRHNIKHKFAVFTDKDKTKGLDLSKAVVVKDDQKYVDRNKTAYISKDEYKSLRDKNHFVKQKLKTYIKQYKKANKNRDIPRNDQLCRMSCLQYFHEELGI